MTDVLTRSQRHRCMSRIRARDTSPERAVRCMIHRMGYRFRLHVVTLPGKPDIVLPGMKRVILVHGCFWHMHTCRFGRVKPATNAEFWRIKREGTRQRDAKVRHALRKAGWDVLTVWECELRELEVLRERVLGFLDEDKGISGP